MKRTISVLAFFVAFVTLHTPTAAGSSSHIGFDLYDSPVAGSLYSVNNATLGSEGNFFGASGYWIPASSGVEGQVTYHYDVPFAIGAATLFTRVNVFYQAFNDPAAYVAVDVSPNGTNWTEVFIHSMSNPILTPDQEPVDVGAILLGSDEVFVRGRMFVSANKSTIISQWCAPLRRAQTPLGRLVEMNSRWTSPPSPNPAVWCSAHRSRRLRCLGLEKEAGCHRHHMRGLD